MNWNRWGKWLWPSLLWVVTLICVTTCEDADLDVTSGTLLTRVLNPGIDARLVQVSLSDRERTRSETDAVATGETAIYLKHVPTGVWEVHLATLDENQKQLRSVHVTDVFIQKQKITELVVDLAGGVVVSLPCGPGDVMPLCTECSADGQVVAIDDDDRCDVDCDPFESWRLAGDNTAAGRSTCLHTRAEYVPERSCQAPGVCAQASADTCQTEEQTVAEAGECRYLDGCIDSVVVVQVSPDGEMCATGKVCQAGVCVEAPDCTPGSDVPVCYVCEGGKLLGAADDERCGLIDCSAFESWEIQGDNTAAGESDCVHLAVSDIDANRCSAPGVCVTASVERCADEPESVLSVGLCQILSQCESAGADKTSSPDGTPCGAGRECRSGACVDVQPEAGCADGTREGFLSLESHPDIAACAGGFSVGGVTRSDLVPTCDRQAGDDGANPAGTGCSAADLCAAGWHVCQGHAGVAAHSDTGCSGAVPAGMPDKSLFFAVSQHSELNSVCDDSQSANDVFGCGNLGTALTGANQCGVLDRVLASTQPDVCGFNEAEPPLGPWRCLGGADSHLSEGGLVTKDGCPDQSCSWEGTPLGNADKGGVLCCRD